MRFMVMVQLTPAREAGLVPTKEAMQAMGVFNETLEADGEIVAMGGLKPSAEGSRIDYSAGKAHVLDGPFTESKELVSGFWLLEASSKDELIERFRSCPFQNGESVEIRPLWTMDELMKIF